MKRNFGKILLSALLCSGLLFSCENFNSGSDLKEQLQETISYSKSKFVSVKIEGSTSGTVSPAANVYDNTYKASDTIKLSFEENSQYQFLYWDAVPSQAVTFKDRTSLSTEAEILKDAENAEQVKITPVCDVRPYPEVTPDKTGTVPKNSSITISFDYALANDAEDFSEIDILMGGNSILEHYKAPELINDGRAIFFEADESNLIDLTSGTKKVSVVIPPVFYYKNSSGSEIKMKSQVTSEFTINYTTSKTANINLLCEHGSMNRSGTVNLYLNDEITFIYTMESGYKFFGWNLYGSDGGVVSTADDIVYLDGVPVLQILDETDLDGDVSSNKFQIKYRVLDEIKIINLKPEVCERPVVEDFSPDSRLLSSYPKNSNIVITFSKKMELTEENLSEISITSNGEDLKPYFKEVSADSIVFADVDGDGETETQVTFEADNENLIELMSGTKTVTVTVPGDFYYKTNDGKQIEFDESGVVKTYKINSKTVEQAKINFCIEGGSLSGELNISGEKSYNYGDSFTVSFTPYDGYRFVEWKVEGTSSEELENIIEYTADNANGVLTGKITGNAENITITAVACAIDVISVNIFSDKGTLTPSGEFKSYAGNSTSIMFIANSDYQFTGWKVYNAATGKELPETQDYIKIDNPKDFRTNLTLLNKPSDEIELEIVPESSIRPKILSTSPLYSASGVYRDTRIQVMFDQKISEDAIYFTDEEAAQLENDGCTMLVPSEDDKTDRYYGYVGTDGFIYFKNISVTNASTKQSILSNFRAPYFDELSNLIIPAKSGTDAPKSGITVVVELSKNLFYCDGENQIEMSGSEKWNYRVNSFTDMTGPDFEECHLFRNKDSIELTAGTSFEMNQTNLVAAHLSDNAYKLYVKFNDSGSGPEKLTVSKKRIYNEYYEAVNEDAVIQSFSVDIVDTVAYYGEYSETGGQYEKSSGGYYDPQVFDLNDDQEGVYEISVIAIDLCGNSTTKKYYVVKDTVANVISNPEAIAGDSKITLNWKNSADIDVSSITINDVSYTSSTAGSEASEDFTGLSNGTTYTYEIKAKDIFGHQYSSGEIKRSTIPCAPVYSNAVINDNLATLNWTNPNGNRTNTVIYCTTTGKSAVTTASSFQVPGMSRGKQYSFTLRNYYKDEDGTDLYSAETSAITIRTRPAPATSAKAVSGDGQISLSWTAPAEGDYSGVKIYYKKSSDSAYTYYDSASKGTNTKTVSGLSNGITYDFALAAFDVDGYESATRATATKSTVPNYIDSSKITATTNKTTLTLSWTKPSGNYTGTRLYVSRNEITSLSGLTPVETTGTSCPFSAESDGTAFVKGKTYYFRLYGYYTEGSETLVSTGYATKTRNTVPNDVEIHAELAGQSDADSKTVRYYWTKPEGTCTGVTIVVDDDFSDSESLAVNITENILVSTSLEKSVTFNSYSLETTAEVYAYDDEGNHSENTTTVKQYTGIAPVENLAISGNTMTFTVKAGDAPKSILIKKYVNGIGTTQIYSGALTEGTYGNYTISIAASGINDRKITVTGASDFTKGNTLKPHIYSVILYGNITDSYSTATLTYK